MSHTIHVNLGSRSYDVVAGHEVIGTMRAFGQRMHPSVSRTVVLYDASADALVRHLSTCYGSLHFPAYVQAVATGGEKAKSWHTAGELLKELECVAPVRFDRNALYITFGGGIIGDLGGFVAATFKRGIRWINVPTTLLAMVDASVGGKTGVNIIGQDGTIHKNMVGAFHQPSLVVVDTQWLETLPVRQVRAGLAECIKHALLCRSVPGFTDHALFDFTKNLIERRVDVSRDHALAAELVARNVTLKARVVEQDEFERAPDALGGRALLNLGHTFAHVIEGLPNLDILHGEAVGLGLIAACRTARVLGRVTDTYVRTVESLVAGAGLPTALAGLPASSDLVHRMRADKKTVGGSLRLVLPVETVAGEYGHAQVVAGPPEEAVQAGWDALRS